MFIKLSIAFSNRNCWICFIPKPYLVPAGKGRGELLSLTIAQIQNISVHLIFKALLFLHPFLLLATYSWVLIGYHSYLTPWTRVLLEKLIGSQSRNSLYLMGSEGSVQPATFPYSEPDQYSPCCPSHFIKIHFHIIFPSAPGSSKWSVSLTFPHQNSAYTSPLPP